MTWQGSTYDPPDFDRSDDTCSRLSRRAIAGDYRSRAAYFDFDSDGELSDDERDEDSDGLTNYDESPTAGCSRVTGRAATSGEMPFGVARTPARTSSIQDTER